MSPVKRSVKGLAIGCALLGVLTAGCSKKNGVAFDPDAGHPHDFFPTHPAEYASSGGACADCHGEDLLGGISAVSCSSASRDGQACHQGGPRGEHPAGWRSTHTRVDPGQASSCAECHRSKANPPGCFNGTLCHGAKGSHPAGWRTDHQSTSQGDATGCAECHADKGTPSCFTTSACHGSVGGHPVNWSDGSQHGKAAEAAPGEASGMGYCASCHGSTFVGGQGPSCVTSTCHGGNAPHPKSDWSGEDGRHKNVDTGNTAVCARCHPEIEGSPNCRNTNGCHDDG